MEKQFLQEEMFKIKGKLELVRSKMDFEGLNRELLLLKQQMLEADFWEDVAKATVVSKKVKHLEDKIDDWNSILLEVDDALAMLNVLSEADYNVLCSDLRAVLSKAKHRYLESLLNHKYDQNSAILSVICGTGGKDAQDFTEILAKMYLKYAEKQDFQVDILEESRGDEVGLKQIVMLVEGVNAYGYLKNEHGVHRLVRQSPFNSGNTRETSFSMVDVVPKIEMLSEVAINEVDLKIDSFRASGAGGQHVNTTDSAVRITHIPTGIVVSSQSDRSQHKNKAKAMQVLYGKLHQLLLEQNVANLDQLRGVKKEMSWGNQIRSYVLHPYKMVKDHRTGYEVNDCESVFGGDIQAFIEAALLNV